MYIMKPWPDTYAACPTCKEEVDQVDQLVGINSNTTKVLCYSMVIRPCGHWLWWYPDEPAPAIDFYRNGEPIGEYFTPAVPIITPHYSSNSPDWTVLDVQDYH